MSQNSQNQPEHLPKLGCFIYLLVTAAMLSGFLYGYNSGVVSPVLLYLPKDKNMKPVGNVWQELIVAITPGMAGVGSLPAGLFSDKFGRKKVIICSSLIYTIGALLCAIAFAKWILLIGRILIGLALGLSSMIVPIYVSEASPTHIRGKLLTCYQLLLGIGIVAGNIVGGIFSYIDNKEINWRLMLGFAAIPSIIQFISFLFLPESPKFLYEKAQSTDVEHVLKRIFNNDKEWVKYEMDEIQKKSAQHRREMELKGGKGPIIWQILKTPHIRRALLLGCALHSFQQLAGVNAILYYTSKIIKSMGVKDDHNTIWISVGTSMMNLVTCIVPILFIEKLGRRIILLGSVSGACLCLVLIGAGFLVLNKTSEDSILPDSNTSLFNSGAEHYDVCRKFTNCDYCVTNEDCGFCSSKVTKQGYCLPQAKNDPGKYSSTGFCTETQHNFTQNYTWYEDYCATKYTGWIIVFIFIYLGFFGAGYAPLPWVFNSEFYPLWARGTCVSLATFCHWIFNLLITLTFLSLNEAITKYGSFFLYAGITFVGLILYIVFIPETKGMQTEDIERLFMTKSELQNSEVKRKPEKT